MLSFVFPDAKILRSDILLKPFVRASLADLILLLPPILPCLDISAFPSRNLVLCTCAGGNGILVYRRGGVGVKVPFGYDAGGGFGNSALAWVWW